ncbi:MAG: hypothetical protein J1F40_08820 [Prevotellaceae bacterium]|nr:hypothetical protein [Prevotellaceae bacterium]
MKEYIKPTMEVVEISTEEINVMSYGGETENVTGEGSLRNMFDLDDKGDFGNIF